MKYIKVYETFTELERICEKYGITNYTINNGLVDVSGSVNLTYENLKELPLRFGKITGNLNCASNNLTSLEGCTSEVGGEFNCSFNNLTSLKGCPEYVSGNFLCSSNKLTSLEGCPSEVDGFACSYNKLTSLKGCPQKVSTDFYCSNNQLTSLLGCPKSIYGDLYFKKNKIKSLKGLIKVEGELNCEENPVYEIFKLFPDQSSFLDSLDYDYFRGGNKINKVRLTQALKEFGLECLENIPGYVWE